MTSPKSRLSKATFIAMVSELTSRTRGGKESLCSCGSKYLAVLSGLTERRCVACALEVFYQDTSVASKDALDLNLEAGLRRIQAQEARPYRQQHGQGKTDGG